VLCKATFGEVFDNEDELMKRAGQAEWMIKHTAKLTAFYVWGGEEE